MLDFSEAVEEEYGIDRDGPVPLPDGSVVIPEIDIQVGENVLLYDFNRQSILWDHLMNMALIFILRF